MSTPLTPQAPLTPEEQQQIARLLSDPFYFPLQFKTWLQWFIEGAEGGIAGGGGSGGSSGVLAGIPIGGIIFWTTPTLPTNAIWCNGAALSRTVYNALFLKIGTRYGVGDGSTTFNAPDVEGRMIVGQAQPGAGGHADVSTLGGTEGEPKASRRPRHKHSSASHSHTLTGHRTVYSLGGSGGTPGFDIAGINDFAIWTGPISARTADVGTDAAATPVGPQTGAEPLDSPAFIVLPAIMRYI